MMTITIIGSGNVAEAFAIAISKCKSLKLQEIYSRNKHKGTQLAQLTSASYSNSLSSLSAADLYLIAVSDSAISEVSATLNIPENSVVAHLSGGTPLNTLSDNIRHKAVIYPLQTFTCGRNIDFKTIPLFIEYNSVIADNIIRQFASTLSDVVLEANSDKRNKLHIAAVFACNFTNQLYNMAAELIHEESLPFEVLKPLITETAAKVQTIEHPVQVQTGPAARGDNQTIEHHLAILQKENKDKYSEIYKLLSNNIWETLKKT